MKAKVNTAMAHASSPCTLRAAIQAACLAGIAAASLLVGGCKSAEVAQPVTATYTGDTFESEMDFWHTLPTQPAVSNADAVRALLGVLAGESGGSNYEARITNLKQRGWLAEGFNELATQAATRGTIATIVASGLDIKGGVMMRLLGPTPRYATRELHALNLYPQATSPNQTISGADLIGLLNRVEAYRRLHNLGSVAAADAAR